MSKIKNLSGLKFGKLTVMERAEDKRSQNGRNHIMYICKCDCGKQVVVKAENLRSGNTKSCGCLSSEKTKERLKKHGMHGTRIYVIWQGMKSRCNNPHSLSYANYGNRGIKVCNEWQNDFDAFKDWAYKNGYKDNLTLDRIDNNKGYSPSNCRWATNSEQQLNKRNNHIVYYKGDYIPLAKLSNITGINAGTLRSRLNKGMSAKDAVNYRRKLLLFSFNGETKTLKEWCEKIGINYSTAYRRYRKGLPIDEILRKVK